MTMFDGKNVDIKMVADASASTFTVTITEVLCKATEAAMIEHAAELIAEKYVAENYAKIAERMSPLAIANLALARAAKDVAKAFVEPQVTGASSARDLVVGQTRR